MTRVCILAQVRFFREGLAQALESEDGVRVVSTATRLDEAVAGIVEHRADLALVDMAMRESLEALRALVASFAGVRVIALGAPEEERRTMTGAELAPAGYVPAEGSLQDLLEAIRHAGARPTPAAERHQTLAHPPLTAREVQILALIDEGYSNKEIAQLLYIEVPTVKNHVHHILTKLQVHRRSQAAACTRAQRWRPG